MVGTPIDAIQYPIAIVFSIVGGAFIFPFIFLQTYRHFPKMDSRQRWMLALENSVILSIALTAALFIFIIVLVREFA
ncbi:MAG: hypothetical protein QXK08_04105 [Candidatus Woesearchaeota archaeon]